MLDGDDDGDGSHDSDLRIAMVMLMAKDDATHARIARSPWLVGWSLALV
jgi:hypothetical protein